MELLVRLRRHGLALAAKIAVSASLSLLTASPAVFAHPFMGDASVTEASPIGASVNPSLAAMVPANAVQATPQIYESNTITTRYPGFDPVSKPKAGLGNIQTFLPVATFRFGNFGLSISDVLPPINAPLAVEQVPIIVLNQQSLVDIDILAKVRGGFNLGLGYKFGESFAAGIQLGYKALGADVTLRPSGKETPLAVVSIDQADTKLVAGLTFAMLDGRLRLGVAAELYHMTTISNKVTSDLLGGGDTSTATGTGTSTDKSKTGEADSQLSAPLSSVILGVSLNLGSTTVAIEGQYTKAPVGQQEFSIAELKQKDKEVYDTFVGRGGIRIKTAKIGDVMFGGRYDTSAVGQGSRGNGGMAGFSTIDLVQVYAGQAQLKPSMAFGGGVEMPFGKPKKMGKAPPPKKKIVSRRDKSKKDPPIPPEPDRKMMYPIILGVGLVYQKASLGVDEKGEQPAAYTQTRIFIPVSVIYYF